MAKFIFLLLFANLFLSIVQLFCIRFVDEEFLCFYSKVRPSIDTNNRNHIGRQTYEKNSINLEAVWFKYHIGWRVWIK